MTLNLEKSAAAFAEAKQVIPGGVNSPVRSFRSAGGTPPFIAKASGSHIYDIDGNDYIDYIESWGPMILGHAHPEVTSALQKAILAGTSYGAPTLLETELAELVTRAVPSIEMVRMVNSGTEATMSVLRLARAYTKRNKIIKFAGCYHGHHDSLLVKAGSGATTFGVPDSPGVPAGVVADTITVPYNDIDAITKLFNEQGDEIAAVIVEPVAGNMGCVPPVPGFLEALRELTKAHGSVLIFDEVMCGFRASAGGAQKKFGIKPDLTCLGKIVGGGMPMAVFGGRRDIMSCVAPAGPVYQAGTLSGNPIAMTAGLATLSILQRDPTIFKRVEAITTELCDGLRERAAKHGIPVQVQQVGSMFTLFFSDKPVRNFDDANACDMAAFTKFFRYCLEHGIYYAPSQYESNFVSDKHSARDVEHTLAVADEAFALLAGK